MRAIILCGGYGKRLAPLTLRLPKSLVPVAGESVLGHLLRLCSISGITHAVLSLNVNQKVVEDHFGAHAFGMKLSYHYESSKSDADKPGAIGALYQVVQELGSEESVLLGGDNTVFGLDLKKMLAFHRGKKAAATLALYELTNQKLVCLYGIAKSDPDGRLSLFQEKPKSDEAVSNTASTLLYVLSEEFLSKHLADYVENQRGKTDQIGDLWNYFVDKIPLYGFPFSGVWGDANSPESYLELHARVMQLYPARFDVAKSAILSESAKILPPVVIGDRCRIESGAIVGPNCALGTACVVEKNARVEGSILFDGVKIGQKARVFNSAADKDSTVGEQCLLEPFSIVGEGATIGPKAKIRGVRVWPNKKVPKGANLEADLT